jgi:hypothetical protein
MSFDFPASPTTGTLYQPAGGPTYRWNGTVWSVVAAQFQGAMASDVAPANPVPGQLWWESDTGALFYYYDDGNTKQWVQVVADSSGVVRYDFAQTLTAPQKLQAQQNIGVAGRVITHVEIGQNSVASLTFTGLPPGAVGMEVTMYNCVAGAGAAGQQFYCQMRDNAGAAVASGYRGSVLTGNAAPGLSGTSYMSLTNALAAGSTGIGGMMRMSRGTNVGWSWSAMFALLGGNNTFYSAGDMTAVGANPTGFIFGVTNANVALGLYLGIDYW